MIKITTDSTADLGENAKKNGVGIVPLKVVLGTDTFIDGVDITPNDIFSFVEKTKVLPKTSAPSTEDYREFFAEQVKDGAEVVHYSISSKSSASYFCACTAAKEFDGKVHVVDSMALSTGMGLLVMKACDLIKEGKSAEEIVAITSDLREKVNTSFIPDRLDYLYKGGRCSKMEMYGANLLKIHPMIAMKDGTLCVKRKYRGKMSVCLRSYVEDLKNDYPKYDKKRCFITHTQAEPELIEEVKSNVKEKFGFEEIIVTVAGCVVTGHAGKNTVGVLFIGE